MKAQEELKGNLNEREGGLMGWVHSDQMVQGSHTGKVDRMSGGLRRLKGAIRLDSTQIRWFSRWPGEDAELCELWPKDTQWNNLSSRRAIRLDSTQIRWFSWWSGREAWTEGQGDQWPKMLKKKLIVALGCQGTYVNRQSDSPKKDATYSFSGDVKMGECCRLSGCRWVQTGTEKYRCVQTGLDEYRRRQMSSNDIIK